MRASEHNMKYDFLKKTHECGKPENDLVKWTKTMCVPKTLVVSFKFESLSSIFFPFFLKIYSHKSMRVNLFLC